MSEAEAVYQHLEAYNKFYNIFFASGYGFNLRHQVAQKQGFTSIESLSGIERLSLDREFLLSQIPTMANRQKDVQEDVIAALKLTYQYYSTVVGYKVTRPLLTTLHMRAFGITPSLSDTYLLYKKEQWEEFAVSFDTLFGQTVVLEVTTIPTAESADEMERGFLNLTGHLPVHLRDQHTKEAAETYFPYQLLLQQDRTGVAAIQANIEDITGLAKKTGILIPELVERGARFSHALYQIRYPLTEGVAPEWGS